MHSRASSYVQPNGTAGKNKSAGQVNSEKSNKEYSEAKPQENLLGNEAVDKSENDSSLILIILMILISQGNADDKLLLALLYLLF